MTDPSNGQEPSMEDILASIRRIIDEDDRKAAAPAGQPAEDDVLELTDTVEEAAEDDEVAIDALTSEEGPAGPVEEDIGGEIWAADDEITPPDDAGEPLDLTEPVAAPQAASGAHPMTMSESREGTMTASSNDRLVSDAALSSAAAALGNLARASERDPMAGVPQGRPVEDLVMELLRPMLREWLDQHLPTIVERIVEREVRYLSRRLGGDDGA
jgi:cell pole-organizing protein PopZ